MIFITGGTGLVGSHILLNLSQGGHSFKALKRKNSSLKICENIFSHYNAEKLFQKIIWVDGDVNDIPSLERGMSGCNKIIHAAAIVSFHQEDAQMMYKINVIGTENVMNVALNSEIKKVAHISSIAAIGTNENNQIIDENCLFKQNKKDSNYALSKYLSEQEVWRASHEGLNVVIINPSVILGPGDWKKGSSQIFRRIYKGLRFYTSGSSGYVDVIDVANCTVLLLESNIKGERFIVSGENIKYRDLFDLIAEKFKKRKATIKVTPFLKEIAWRIEFLRNIFSWGKPLITKETANASMRIKSYSNKKIKDILDYQFIPIKESVKNYCKWFESNLSQF